MTPPCSRSGYDLILTSPSSGVFSGSGFERTDPGMNYTVNFNTNAGTATGAPTVDILGVARKAPYTAGAYSYPE